MNEVIIKDEVIIENLIYEIRGKQVMIDSDLAKLYGCTNGIKDINKVVKRNIERFPGRFMFQLTKEEYNNLRFQLETKNNINRSLPYVLIEQGVAMLSSILHSNLIGQKYINNMVIERNYEIKLLFLGGI